MNLRRITYGVFVALVGIATPYVGYAQGSPVDHATRVLDLLEAGKFEEVAAEFSKDGRRDAGLTVARYMDDGQPPSRSAHVDHQTAPGHAVDR